MKKRHGNPNKFKKMDSAITVKRMQNNPKEI